MADEWPFEFPSHKSLWVNPSVVLGASQKGKDSPTPRCFLILRLRSGPASGKQRSCSLQGLEECMEDGGLGFQRTFRADTFLQQLVNHNGDPPPVFHKLIPKGFKFFRKNTCRSVDSAWFIGAKSNT